MVGKVYLIGAGPGDPGLLTIKGADCISKAEVLVYDRLSSSSILSLAREDAELIFVGKAPGRHSKTQEEINDILVEQGLKGKMVARIKGGDPFVFGRGGEEALALLEHSIPFEVVPGVTSAIAAPAYGGIPVTHRAVSPSFHVITGNRMEDVEGLDFSTFAKLKGTLLFLMGVRNLPTITSKLMENGMSPETPAALVHRGTTGKQRQVCGVLSDITEKANAAGIGSPSIIVIGDVVKLSEKLQWLEKKPLTGVSVAVTRARAQASDLCKKLEDLGAAVHMFPLIKIEANPGVLEQAVQNPASVVAFTSQNAVSLYFEELKKQRVDVRNLFGKAFFSVGEKTTAALEAHGIYPYAVPEKFTGEELAKLMIDRLPQGSQVVLLRSDIAAKSTARILEIAGFDVTDLPVYKTVMENRGAEEFMRLDTDGDMDYITFTSSSTVRNYLRATGGHLPRAKVVCIGDVTARTAKEAGMTVFGVPKVFTIDGMIDTILELEKR